MTEMEDRILLMNMIANAQVTERAVLRLCHELLSERGPLPIGEVGKIMGETTFIVGFSAILKMKYGGLKRLLLRNVQMVAIANDHPFNPYILLRDSLTAEENSLVEKGLFPPSAIARLRQVCIFM